MSPSWEAGSLDSYRPPLASLDRVDFFIVNHGGAFERKAPNGPEYCEVHFDAARLNAEVS